MAVIVKVVQPTHEVAHIAAATRRGSSVESVVLGLGLVGRDPLQRQGRHGARGVLDQVDPYLPLEQPDLGGGGDPGRGVDGEQDRGDVDVVSVLLVSCALFRGVSLARVFLSPITTGMTYMRKKSNLACFTGLATAALAAT